MTEEAPMNLAELNKVAKAMVAPGRGILAADESSGTIKKRFDAIGVESTADSRRDYRELLFRSSEAMSKYISGVILYDETIRQNAKDGTPLVKVIEKAGALPGIKVDKGTKPLPFSPGEIDHRGPRRAARAPGRISRARRQVRQVARGDRHRRRAFRATTAIITNAHALARYAALCQEEGIVPIVEPEVLMDGEHDIDRCFMVSEWLLNTVFEQLYYQKVAARRHGAQAQHGDPRQEERQESLGRRGRREDREGAQGLRAGRRARHRVSLRRPVGRGGDRASRRHEQDRRRCPGSSPSATAAPCRRRRRRPGPARARTSPPRSAPSPIVP